MYTEGYRKESPCRPLRVSASCSDNVGDLRHRIAQALGERLAVATSSVELGDIIGNVIETVP